MAAKVAGTWRVISPLGISQFDLAEVDTTQRYPLGTVCRARDVGTTAYGEGQFIYLKGVTSCARGSVVTITGAYTAVLGAARAKGAVGFALAAVDAATKFGWFQVMGKGVAASQTVSDGAQAYLAASGTIDDAVVAGDAIHGAFISSDSDTSTCLVTMVTRPAVTDGDNT